MNEVKCEHEPSLGPEYHLINGVHPRSGEKFTAKVPLRQNPDLDDVRVPTSAHIHEVGTSLMAELVLRLYNSIAADVDAFLTAHIFPFTRDKFLRPGVTVRRRFSGAWDAERTFMTVDWETWTYGRSGKKVMPKSSRRTYGGSGKTYSPLDQSRGLKKRLSHSPAALARALELEARLSHSRAILVGLQRMLRLIEDIDSDACPPVGIGHAILVGGEPATLPIIERSLDASGFLLSDMRVPWSYPWPLLDYFHRRYAELTADLDYIFCQLAPWQNTYAPGLRVGLRRRVSGDHLHYNWCYQKKGVWRRNVLTESDRLRQSRASFQYEGDALRRAVKDSVLLDRLLEIETRIFPYRAAQARLSQIINLLKPLIDLEPVPHVPTHQIRLLTGAYARLSLRVGRTL